jgi:hypothetical protein
MDTALGLVELALYVVFILALSAGTTWLVVKIAPVGGRKKPAQDEPS